MVANLVLSEQKPDRIALNFSTELRVHANLDSGLDAFALTYNT
jgi:hypothetical protein